MRWDALDLVATLIQDEDIFAEIVEESSRFRSRKAKVRCNACGDDALYTWGRLKKGRCRNCNQLLDVNGASYLKAEIALHARRVNLALEGKHPY